MTEDAFNFDALSKAQRDALGLIAVNLVPKCNDRTLRALRDLGLLTERERHLSGHPPAFIKTYEMPVHVHMQWCAWCSRKEMT